MDSPQELSELEFWHSLVKIHVFLVSNMYLVWNSGKTSMSMSQTWIFQATAGKKIKFTLGKNHSKNFKIKLQNIRNQVQIDRGLDYSTVCIYFKLTVSILIGQNVVRHVVLEHKLGRSRLMHKIMAKPVKKMTWREFAEWKNAKVRKLQVKMQEVLYIFSFKDRTCYYFEMSQS